LACEALEDRCLLAGDLVAFEPMAVPYVVTASTSEEASPLAGSASPGGYAPAQMRHAYGFDQIFFEGGTIVGDGAGQTIAIVNAYHTPTAAADLAAFNAYFALPAPPSFVQVDQNGGTNYPGTSSGWALETALDIQWAHAFAPGANILLVEAASANFSDLMVAVDYARNQPGVSVVSMSWGANEFASETNYDFHFTTPVNHAGVTFFAAAGNSGGPGVYPAYSPNVVAVGGTSLSLNGANNIASETAWSGSGGGLSQYESQPVWQNGVVTQSTTQRGMPDVAFDANPSTGVPVYDTFNNSAATPWSKVAGTSFATPSWAALVAIADQGRTLAGLPVLDMPTLMTMLYAMPAGNFNDITSGASGGSAPQAAGPGYDLVTGRGTPRAQLVAASLVGVSTVSGVVFDDTNGDGTFAGEPGLGGWTVFADLNTNAAFDPVAMNQFNASDVPQTIPTVGTSTVTSDIVVSGLAGNVIDVNVTVNVNHTNVGDLVLTLIAPDGSEYTLADHVGASGDNFSNTLFDDGAAVSISQGAAPFAGSFRPMESLAGLFAANPNGTWRLRIDDTTFFNGGSLGGWSIAVTTGDPSTLSQSDGSYVLEGLPEGVWQIREVLEAPYVQTAPAGGFYTVNLSEGQSATTRDFGNQVPQSAAGVVSRLVFYNQSAFDGDDAGTSAADDAAIADDKVAYLGGGTAGSANVTSYARGINGIMVDLDTTHGTLSAADFTFKMSGAGVAVNNAPGTWAPAPAPLDVVVRAGEGEDGSDRVAIVWAAGTVVDRWLQVVVEGNDAAGGFNTNTGLAASDVFYFGNKVGDTFLAGGEGFFGVDATDQVQVRLNQGVALSTANVFDFNRDALVDAIDQIIARSNQGYLIAINIADPPAEPEAAPVVAGEPATAEAPAADPGEVALTKEADRPDPPRKFDRALALAAAHEHWRLRPAAFASQGPWSGDVDEELVGLLVDGRLWSRRR
jgi:subtilisin-like proprotein convertase family protein